MSVSIDAASGDISIDTPDRLPADAKIDEQWLVRQFFPGAGLGPTIFIERTGHRLELTVYPPEQSKQPRRRQLGNSEANAFLNVLRKGKINSMKSRPMQAWDGVEYHYCRLDRSGRVDLTVNNPERGRDDDFLRMLHVLEQIAGEKLTSDLVE